MKLMDTLPNLSTIHGQRKERELITLTVILAALWVILTLIGCSKQSQQTSTTDTSANGQTSAVNTPESTSTTTPSPNGTSTSAANTGNMSDANIIAQLSEADSAEISEAKLVLQKSKNPEVKNFAKMMIADHNKMKMEKADLARKLNITPQPPSNDQMPSTMTNEMNALSSASSPAALDSIYINTAVKDHQQDLSEVKELETKASSPQLKDALKKAAPVIQKHLDHAEMIQKTVMKENMASTKKTR